MFGSARRILAHFCQTVENISLQLNTSLTKRRVDPLLERCQISRIKFPMKTTLDQTHAYHRPRLETKTVNYGRNLKPEYKIKNQPSTIFRANRYGLTDFSYGMQPKKKKKAT